MTRAEIAQLTTDEARGVMLAAQGLLEAPPLATTPGIADVQALVERLGVVQIDTINVVRRTQYLVLWSRLGVYDDTLLDALLYPNRAVLEYWSHAASIVPMADYPYYRANMVRAAEGHLWSHLRQWREDHPDIMQQTLQRIRDTGPMASADFERPTDARRMEPWDWFGPKESRRALDVLWTMGDLMIHSRRAGQKVYDVRERVIAEAFGGAAPSDDDLPSSEEFLRHFMRRTVRALGVVTPGWFWDYFRVRDTSALGHPTGMARRLAARHALDLLQREGAVVPVSVEGLSEPAYLDVERLPDLERLRAGATPERTTLLSPFDSLIWDRQRARQLFGYEVVFEAYVVPEKRRYGYYCLAILHRGRLVGRIDPKMDRATRCLLARAVYLEPGVVIDDALLDGVAGALRELARFLGATSIVVERSEPTALAAPLRERVGQARKRRSARSAKPLIAQTG